MKKNILNLYEGFFDDLDKLNPNQNKEDKVNDGFGDVNGQVYDEHDFILSPDKNPEFFYGLCEMLKVQFSNYNKYGFTQNDLDQITYLDDIKGYFENIISLDELQYFHNLQKICKLCFYKSKKLKSVKFPENLEIIDFSAFEECSSLKEIVFPENILTIDVYSFQECTSLEKIVIPKKFKKNIKVIFYKVDLTNVDITYI